MANDEAGWALALPIGCRKGGGRGFRGGGSGGRCAAMGTRGLRDAVVELQPGQARGAGASGTGDTVTAGTGRAEERRARWGVGGGAVGHWCSGRCLAVPGAPGRTLPCSLEAAAAAAVWPEAGGAMSPLAGSSSVLALRHWRAVGASGAESWAVQYAHGVKPA